MRNFLQRHIHNWLLACLMGVVFSLSAPLATAHVSAAPSDVPQLTAPFKQFATTPDEAESERQAYMKKLQTDCPKGQCLIDDYVNPAIKALTYVAGIFVILSIVLAGIQYSISTDDPQKVSAAKDRITKAIIAFLMFLLLFAFLNYVVPEGVNGTGTGGGSGTPR